MGACRKISLEIFPQTFQTYAFLVDSETMDIGQHMSRSCIKTFVTNLFSP